MQAQRQNPFSMGPTIGKPLQLPVKKQGFNPHNFMAPKSRRINHNAPDLNSENVPPRLPKDMVPSKGGLIIPFPQQPNDKPMQFNFGLNTSKSTHASSTYLESKRTGMSDDLMHDDSLPDGPAQITVSNSN